MRARSTYKVACATGLGGVWGGSSSATVTSSAMSSSSWTQQQSCASTSALGGAYYCHRLLSTSLRAASTKAAAAVGKKKKVAVAPAQPSTKKTSAPTPSRFSKSTSQRSAASDTNAIGSSPSAKEATTVKHSEELKSNTVKSLTAPSAPGDVMVSSFGPLTSADLLAMDHIRIHFVEPLDEHFFESALASCSDTAFDSQLTLVATAAVVPLVYELGVPVSLDVLLEVLAEPMRVAIGIVLAKGPPTDPTVIAMWKDATKAGEDGKRLPTSLRQFFQRSMPMGGVSTLVLGSSHPVLLVTMPPSKCPKGEEPSSYVLPASYECFLRRIYPGIRDDASRSLSHIMRIAGWHGFGVDRVVQEPVLEQCVVEDDDEFGGEAAQIGGGMLLGENSYDAVKRDYNYDCSQHESTVYMAYLCHIQRVVLETNHSLRLLVSFDLPMAAEGGDACMVEKTASAVPASGLTAGTCLTTTDERLTEDRVLRDSNNAHQVFLQRQATGDDRFASVNELIRLLGHHSRRATSKKQYQQFHKAAVKEEGERRKELDAIDAISHTELYQEVVMKESKRIQTRGLPAAIRYLKLERGILATLDPYLQQYNNQGHKSDRVDGPAGVSAPSTDYSVLEKPAAERLPATTPDVALSTPRTLEQGPRPPPTSAELISCASRVSSPQFMHDIMAVCPSKRSEDGTPLPAWCFPFYAGYFLTGDDLQGIADKHVARAIKYVLMYDKAEDERETLRNACIDIKRELAKQYPYIVHLHGMILAATFRFFRSHEQLHRALKKSVDAADDEEVKKSRIKEIMMGNLRNSLTELEFVIDATMMHIETASHIPGRRTSVQDPEDVKQEKAGLLFQYWYVDWLSRVATTKT